MTAPTPPAPVTTQVAPPGSRPIHWVPSFLWLLLVLGVFLLGRYFFTASYPPATASPVLKAVTKVRKSIATKMPETPRGRPASKEAKRTVRAKKRLQKKVADAVARGNRRHRKMQKSVYGVRTQGQADGDSERYSRSPIELTAYRGRKVSFCPDNLL